MIHIKCRACGWSLPFSSKGNEDTVKRRGDSKLVCPNCGKTLIQTGGKVQKWK
ncbi:MAG: hypothetical protein KAJ44_03975 [Thermoplasmatales archaeon]|nr:hypothetical protein [Thermoplasmatales archaeon]